MAFGELIVWYLFLGGTAAGSFTVLSVIDLREALFRSDKHRFVRLRVDYLERRARSTQRCIAKTGYSISFVMLAVGMLCLLADLGRPEAFYLLFLYPTGSLVSIGTYALTMFAACLAIALADSVLELGPRAEKVSLVAKAIGAVLAVIVMAYTGLLLKSVIAVSLWQSAWLPVLFVFSALSCGCAVVMLSICINENYVGALARIRGLTCVDAGIIALETIAAVSCVVAVNSGSIEGPFHTLLVGDGAATFWLGFVGCGILVPLAIEMSALLARRNHRSAATAVLAVFVLVGGFSLRFVLVSAGVQTAV